VTQANKKRPDPICHPTETYGYDTTSQLTSADYGTSSPLAKASAPVTRETFAYDALGNRTQVGRVVPNAPSTTTAYTANALNQYTQVAGVAFTYDANGNLTSDGKQTYRYDAQNRLLAVEPVAAATGAVRAEFAYDARNRAVARTYYTLGKAGAWVLNPDDSRALTYDIAWNLLAERTPDGVQVAEYIHGQRTDEVLRAELKPYKSSLTAFYPLADGLGSVVALANDSGKVMERFRYSTFGQPTSLSATYQANASSVSGYRLLFTGREWLRSLSLNEHRNRYYSASLARWLSADPIKFNGGDANLYSYVANGPVNFRDPSGLCRDSAGMAACAGDVFVNTGLGSIPLVGGALVMSGLEVNVFQGWLGTNTSYLKSDGGLITAGGGLLDATKTHADLTFDSLGGEVKLQCYAGHSSNLSSTAQSAYSKLSAAKTIRSFLGPVGTLLTIGEAASEVHGCYTRYCEN
jgi:RHS repeat-associated protein